MGSVSVPLVAGGKAGPASATLEATFCEARPGWAVLSAVWAISAVYLGMQLRQGWWPSDAGMLAQTAGRVLRGQIPYRDFVDCYTGGLTYLDALAFRLFGVNLFSLRIPLFLFFLGWVPSVYFIARRFAGPIGAGMVTLLSVAWSVPVYPEAMPSWYNLFFATWGTLALIRYVETEKRRWIWAAGLCSGFSFLFKSTGLYFIAAALLFFVYREISLARRDARGSASGGLFYRLFASVGLLLFLAALASLILQRPLTGNYIQFLIPSACPAFILLRLVWLGESGPSGTRFRCLLAMALPLVAGFVLPMVGFAAWVWHKGALAEWLAGAFVDSTARFLFAAYNPVILAISIGLVPAVLIFSLAGARSPVARSLVRYAFPVGMAALLVLAWRIPLAYLFLGESLPFVVPLLAIYVLFVLGRVNPAAEVEGQRVFLLVAAAVCCALIQFPFSVQMYFCYVAPLVFLGVLAVLSLRPGLDRVALGSLLLFYLVFAVWLRPPAYFQTAQAAPGTRVSLATLQIPRGGRLLVPAVQAKEYEELASLVRAHAHGQYIYCTPDCPEVYFLSGERNPTPTLFEFLDPDFLDIPAHAGRVLNALDSHAVNVVVLHNRGDIFSGPIPAGLRDELDTRYPESRKVGDFEVRWKR